MRDFSIVLALILGAVAVAGGGYATYREIVPLIELAGGDSATFAALRAPATTLPLSIRGQYAVVEACHLTAFSLSTLMRPVEERRQLLAACLSRMNAIAAETPANGFALVEAAALAGPLVDRSAFLAAVSLSQTVSPNEQWLAQRRVEAVEKNFDMVDAAAREGERRDLALLVVSNKGIRSIAQRYIDDPQFRARVVAVVEELGEKDQARFLAEVKRAANDLIGR